MRRMNKYERKDAQSKHLANALHGEGTYLFENNSNADLDLPRATKSGLKKIGPRQQFQGDNYYMQYVRLGYLKYIKEIQSPEQEKAVMQNEEKLILDQPDMVTEQGKVEHVVNRQSPIQKLTEGEGDKGPEVLLNENPVDDGFMIVG